MSYILDALKKSEQERKRGEIPGLSSLQEPPRPPRSTSRLLLYLLVAVLLINSLALGLWVFFRQTAAPAAPVTASSGTPTPMAGTGETPAPAESAPQPAAAKVELPAETVPAAEEGAATEARSPEPKAREGDGVEIIAAVEVTVTGEETGTEEDAGESPPETGEGSDQYEPGSDETPEEAAAEPARLTTFARLPADVRAELPALNISAHYYANQFQARMASINGRIMRQGQKVQDDLTLEEITREGVIFRFRKYRFSMDVFNH